VGDSRTWYDHQVRIIRNDKKIAAYKDAQGFRVGNRKLWVKPANAFIYHYGWVKSPEQMMRKNKNMAAYWNHAAIQAIANSAEQVYNFDEYDSVQKFTGTHPAVMQKRIAAKNWQIELDVNKKRFSFKDRLLYYFEKLTGIRPFDFRNYKLLH
jgi:hypothetical protein